jgi:hypothetical protein
MLADPVVKAMMAADTVDADMLRAQLSNIARDLTNSGLQHASAVSG